MGSALLPHHVWKWEYSFHRPLPGPTYHQHYFHTLTLESILKLTILTFCALHLEATHHTVKKVSVPSRDVTQPFFTVHLYPF